LSILSVLYEKALLRNPLTTVLLGLASLQLLNLPDSYAERLLLTSQEAERICHLLRDILLYARSKALQYVEFEVNAAIQDVLKSLELLPIAQNRIIRFLPVAAVNLQADKSKFQQVLINLVENACEAISVGEIVTVRVEAMEKTVCIEVHNLGHRILPDALPKLMQAFYTTKASGTGLGLAIVKRIVEAHQGCIQIASSDETGTTVSVWLPRLQRSSVRSVSDRTQVVLNK
jgi:signal transduction histidine kinase